MPYCISKKICFLNKQDAEEELLSYRAKYANGPVNVYECQFCGYYHFTSKGEENPKFHSKEGQQRINRESEAEFWLNKFK